MIAELSITSWFNRIPKELLHLVLADFTPTLRTSGAELSARFDISLGGTDSTPSA